jgi:hypothetical protein
MICTIAHFRPSPLSTYILEPKMITVKLIVEKIKYKISLTVEFLLNQILPKNQSRHHI